MDLQKEIWRICEHRIFATRQNVEVVERKAMYIAWKIGQFELKADDAQKWGEYLK